MLYIIRKRKRSSSQRTARGSVLQAPSRFPSLGSVSCPITCARRISEALRTGEPSERLEIRTLATLPASPRGRRGRKTRSREGAGRGEQRGGSKPELHGVSGGISLPCKSRHGVHAACSIPSKTNRAFFQIPTCNDIPRLVQFFVRSAAAPGNFSANAEVTWR